MDLKYEDYEEKKPSIAKLALALAKAQSMMRGAKKDSENPHFKSKYADLASVWDSAREPLTANELSVCQLTEGGPDVVTITTILMHSSGESIQSSLTIRPAKPDAQGVGSAISYGRRYGLAAMVGVVSEDDDGNSASGLPIKQAASENRKYNFVNESGEILECSSANVFLTTFAKSIKSAITPEAIVKNNINTIHEIKKTATGPLLDRCNAAIEFSTSVKL